MTEKNILEKLNFTPDFLNEEVRREYTISSEMKKLWLYQIDIFKEIERICEKYNLKYYAYAGTLIGAVREKGFIPWDDDIDLMMLREDYEIFQRVAQENLPEYMFLQTAFSETDYACPHIKVRNSETTCATKYDFKFRYNKGVFVDIFPIDKVPEDDAEYRRFCKNLATHIDRLCIGAREYYYIEDRFISEAERIRCKAEIEKKGLQRCYYEMECCSAMYEDTDTKKCAFLSFHLTDGLRFDVSDFDDVIEVPFEQTTIKIPKGYDSILTLLYGDYMKPSQAPSSHGSLICDFETPYTDYKLAQE